MQALARKRLLSTSAVLSTLLLLLAALSYVADKPVAELRARWAPAPSQFIRVQDMDVHVRDEGPREDPVPLVLLHGTSASLHTWEGWAEALRQERRVLRFDLPGFALTGPHPAADYRIEGYLQFVLAMLDQLGIEQCVLAGNSLGGQIAWNFAAQHPHRVQRLILVNAAGYPFHPDADIPLGFTLARTPVVSSLLEYTLPRSVVAQSLRDVYGDPAKVTPELIDLYRDLALRAGNRRALIQRFREEPIVHVERIATLSQPTLILWGARDRLFPVSDAQRYATEIANSELVIFEDLGHVPQEEDPRSTAAAVREFLRAKVAQ